MCTEISCNAQLQSPWTCCSLLGSVCQLVQSGASDVEEHPADDGKEEGKDDGEAVVAGSQLHDLLSGLCLLGSQEQRCAQSKACC